MTRAYLISWILVAAIVLAALWGWLALPAGAGIPVHYWSLDGHRHTVASRGVVWVIPLVAVVVLLGLRRAARRGVEAATGAYEATMIGVVGVLLVAEATLIGRAAQPDFNVMGPVALAVAVLLLTLGNVLGKARHDAVFGLRTPWTLANARVWDKTHRFVGRAWVVSGLLLAALALTMREEAALGVSIAACTGLPLLAGIVWSHALYRGVQHG